MDTDRRSERNIWGACYLLAATLVSPFAHAVTAVVVPNASQLVYQTTPDGRVYIRNVEAFAQGQALGCCYNYYIDPINSPEGKTMFAMFLAAVASSSKFNFYIPDYPAAGSITFGGSY